jgi:hypothetical protein
MKNKKIKSALISTFNKEGLEPIVKKLTDNGVVIYSTGGTYEFIKELKLPVVSVESLTEFPEILGGRVKTLHPKVFGGILNQRSSKSDKKDINEHNIPAIDLVVVDLYPFEETASNEDSTHDEIIEKIDIGGVSLIRAAAKNYKDVVVISNVNQYELLERIVDEGLTTTLEEREMLALDAFNATSNYDVDIFKYLLGDTEDFNFSNQDGISDNNLNLSISKDDYNLNDFLLCWKNFGKRPNKIVIHNTYSSKEFDEKIEEFIIEKNVFTEVIPISEDDLIVNDKLFIKLDDNCYLSYIVSDRMSDSSFIDSIIFYYNVGYTGVQDYIGKLNDCILDYEDDDSHKLNTISITQNGLEIEPVSTSNIDIDNIDNYYNSDTFKSVDKLIKKIKKSDKGLSIFYGDRGTGKTSILNLISSKLDRIMIFIPNNMIEHTINNPDFRKFLKRYDKPVLVLDDCEMAFTEIYGRSNMFSSNLLQMVDGFLSDSINCNIITIFNTENEDEIDHSLLECNNLLDTIYFDKLDVEECNNLAKHIESNKKYKNNNKLIDIVKKRSNKVDYELGF